MKKIIFSLIVLVLIGVGCILYINRPEKTELKHIKVAEVTHSMFYAPQYVAHSLGYFEDEGLDVEIMLVPGVKSLYVFLIFCF